MGLCRLTGYEWHRRIDLKVYSGEHFAFALMYFTGSGHFNRSMRALAKQNGWRLSDKGLRKIIRDPQNSNKVLHEGPRIKCRTEHDIFKVMGLDYVEPSQRNGGANVTLASRGEEDDQGMQAWAEAPVRTPSGDRRGTCRLASHKVDPEAEQSTSDRSDSPMSGYDSDSKYAEMDDALENGLQESAAPPRAPSAAAVEVEPWALPEAAEWQPQKRVVTSWGRLYRTSVDVPDTDSIDEDEEDSADEVDDGVPTGSTNGGCSGWACQVPSNVGRHVR
jgi:hypothetical protein